MENRREGLKRQDEKGRDATRNGNKETKGQNRRGVWEEGNSTEEMEMRAVGSPGL